MNINIPNDVKDLLRILNKNGYKAYVVGGCVRDTLLKRKPKDWDITTSATQDKIKECFKDYVTIDTGIQHGTVTVIYSNSNYEITTFRVDGKYSDSRHPDEVAFVSNVMEDLQRRDFTINAMAAGVDGNVFGVENSISDLNFKIIRCVGNPYDRFKEDPLRILRALRFLSQLKFTIDVDTIDAIYKLMNELDNISQERITAEFSKIITGYNADAILLLYKKIIAKIIPELDSIIDLKQHNKHHIYDVYTHSINALSHVIFKRCEYDEKSLLILCLSALFHDIGKAEVKTTDENGEDHFYNHAEKSVEITWNILKRMKFPNYVIDKTCELIKYHDQCPITNSGIKKLFKKLNYDEDQFRRLLVLRKADIIAQSSFKQQEKLNNSYIAEDKFNTILSEKQCMKIKDLVINGNDLLEWGYEGKTISIILQNVLNCIIDGVISNDYDNIKQYVLFTYHQE